MSHLKQLVNHGFFEKGAKKDGSTCYIIHDLLHELARNVSSHECLSIDGSQSQVCTLQIQPSIRHLSINIDGTRVEDRLILKNSLEDFNTLDKRLKVEKLRSLMLFGEHHNCFVKAFGDLFKEAKALRVIFLSEASYEVEDLLHNFYYLVHLRYLRIQSSSPDKTRFPNKLSKFYHMTVLDAKDYEDIIELPRDMSNLVKLRHFLVCEDETHASIVEVGKLKSLQELRRFVVRQGFELKQLGHLVECWGIQENTSPSKRRSLTAFSKYVFRSREFANPGSLGPAKSRVRGCAEFGKLGSVKRRRHERAEARNLNCWCPEFRRFSDSGIW
jgi:hypothetical protein